MPQFDIANFLPQMAWLGLFFAVLYFFVVRATLPKLGKVMDEREERVVGDLQTAETAKAQADAVTQAYVVELQKAQEGARASLAAARGEASKAIEGRLASTDAAIEGKLAEAQGALDTAKGKAVGEIEAIAADAAASIVERLTGTRPADSDAVNAARAALA